PTLVVVANAMLNLDEVITKNYPMARKEDIEQRRVQAAMHYYSRRHFLKESAMGLGGLALGALLGCNRPAGATAGTSDAISFDPAHPLTPKLPPFAGKAKSVIYLHMAGAPSQLELFDYKPELLKMDGQDCPPSLLAGKGVVFIRGVSQMLGRRGRFVP